MPKLNYDTLIERYKELFGDDKVYIYTQDNLKKDIKQELHNMMGFINADGNFTFDKAIIYKGMSIYLAVIVRIINVFFFNSDFNEQYYAVCNKDLTFREIIRRKIISLLKRVDSKFIRSKKSLLSQQGKKYIEAYYRESNQKLLEKYGISLTD